MTTVPVRQAGRRGKLDAVRPVEVAPWHVYTSRLPAPPKQVAVPTVADWGMDGNDQWGDCTMAAAAHCLAAWDVEVDSAEPVPTDTQVVAQYQQLTGSQTPGDADDTGLVELDVLTRWHTDGLFGGPEIAAFAPVDHTNLLDIHQAIAAYGAVIPPEFVAAGRGPTLDLAALTADLDLLHQRRRPWWDFL